MQNTLQKKLTFLLLGLLCLSLPSLALAKQSQVQNQVQVENAGEESNLQVNTAEGLNQDQLTEVEDEENEDESEMDGAMDKIVSSGSAQRNISASQHMSTVAGEVEKILMAKTDVQGVGEQVREIATQQQSAQKEIRNQLDKLEGRLGLTKVLFGSDKQAIKNLNQQMEQNRLRIEALVKLKAQTNNQADQTQIDNLIQVLTNLNVALADQVGAENQIHGIFGWLTNLFQKL